MDSILGAQSSYKQKTGLYSSFMSKNTKSNDLHTLIAAIDQEISRVDQELDSISTQFTDQPATEPNNDLQQQIEAIGTVFILTRISIRHCAISKSNQRIIRGVLAHWR